MTLWRFAATFFYLGKLPIAPGTWGSLGALILWLFLPVTTSVHLSVILILFLLGLFSSHIVAKYMQVHDPSEVIIDEAVGMGISLFMLPHNFGLYLKGGVSRVIVNSIESIALGEDSSAYGDETVYGGMYGLGAKVVHDSGLLFKLEYTKTIYETVKMTSTPGNNNIISADPEIEAFRLAIGYQF